MGEARRRKLAGDVTYDRDRQRANERKAIEMGIIQPRDLLEAGRHHGQRRRGAGCLSIWTDQGSDYIGGFHVP